MDPPLGGLCLARLHDDRMEWGIRVSDNLVSMPSYGGDYALMIANHDTTPPHAHTRLPMVINEFGDWWRTEHRDLFNSIVVDTLLDARTCMASKAP